MAKSKSGGTRSYIRGRVGADVYSIGRDAKGAKQQVVRSLAETVANPQTVSQMRGRMIMSTVMQAVSAMRPIIDHSFDNVPAGQPSISEFISRNYALIKADVAAHPASGGSFSLVKYQEKGVKLGAFVMSAGEAILPSSWVINSSGSVGFDLGENNLTVASLKNVTGMTSDDYMTLVEFTGRRNFSYLRLRINPELADDTVITAENAASLFLQEGSYSITPELQGHFIALSFGNESDGGWFDVFGLIFSQKTANGYQHSNCVIKCDPTTISRWWDGADTVLPTYPVGAEMFLNGGDI